jgi:hypothetical protein
MTRSLAIACAGAVLLGCGGESTHEQTACKVAWQEIVTPEGLRPFYAGASVSHGGRLYVLAESANSPFQSRELGIVFQRPGNVTPMSDSGAPSMGISVAAVGVGTDLFFLSASDASRRFDTTAEVWSELPGLPDDSGTVRAAEGIFVAYNAIASGSRPRRGS